MGFRLQEQQICGNRKQKGSCKGLKACRNQELVLKDSEISLWENENVHEMDGRCLINAELDFGHSIAA